MKNSSAETPQAKKGRPYGDPINKIRTKFWYWSVRNISGLNDGQLDMEFSDTEEDGSKRAYADRIRIFEDIRKNGRNISGGKHYKRGFSLIDRVNDYPGLAGSKDIYESPLWRVVAGTTISFNTTKEHLLELNAVDILNQMPFTLFEDPSAEEMQRFSELTGLEEISIKRILSKDIDTRFRELYDSVFDSFGSLSYIQGFSKEKIDLEMLASYLDQLAFSIVIYRYAMFTGNFHALVASADSVKATLSYLKLAEVKWINEALCDEFFNLVYVRVFMPLRRKDQNEKSLGDAVGQSHAINGGTALEKLIELLDNDSLENLNDVNISH